VKHWDFEEIVDDFADGLVEWVVQAFMVACALVVIALETFFYLLLKRRRDGK